jgi:hypothetical protein
VDIHQQKRRNGSGQESGTGVWRRIDLRGSMIVATKAGDRLEAGSISAPLPDQAANRFNGERCANQTGRQDKFSLKRRVCSIIPYMATGVRCHMWEYQINAID